MSKIQVLVLVLIVAVGSGSAVAHADSGSTFMIGFDDILTPGPMPAPATSPGMLRCDSRQIVGEPPSRLWKSIGLLDMPIGRGGMASCNVWHVGGEFNVTNCHCVSHKGRMAKKLTVNFNRGSNYRSSNCVPMNCAKGLDYAVVRCPGQSGAVEPVKLADAGFPIDLGQNVTLMTFDRDDPPVARTSRGAVQSHVPGAGHFSTSRAKSGNSGSPIFNDGGEVTCLLHSIDPRTENRRGYGKSYCTNIQSILRHMNGVPSLQMAVAAIQQSQDAIRVEESTCQPGEGAPSAGYSTR